MNLLALALPWMVIAVHLVMFSLADDLPHPTVRRVAWITSLVLIVLASAGASIDLLEPAQMLVAVGPAAFLMAHHLLRTAFQKWKGDEPTLVYTGGSGGGRFFYQKSVRRKVGAVDYLYSFLVGACMLVASLPAIGEIVRQTG